MDVFFGYQADSDTAYLLTVHENGRRVLSVHRADEYSHAVELKPMGVTP